MPSSKKQRGRDAQLARQKKKEDRKEELKKLTCTHGCTQDESTLQEYQRRLDEYFNLVGAWNKAWLKDPSVEPNFYKDFPEKYPNLCINENFVKYVVGYCLTLILRDPNYEKGIRSDGARTGMMLALNLILVRIPESKGQNAGDNSINSAGAKYKRYRNRIFTARGLILTAAKYASCSCLNQLAANAKQEEKTRACLSCRDEVPYKEAWLCTGCNYTYYCSRECQTKNW